MLVKFFRKVLILPIRFYQVCISPFLPKACRYYPSCSDYAIEAIRVHGVFKGAFWTLRRILRCNSLFEGGFDPVPPLKSKDKAGLDNAGQKVQSSEQVSGMPECNCELEQKNGPHCSARESKK